MSIDNFEDAVAEAHAKGFHIRNCFERSAGGWQANLGAVGAKVYSKFGIATTPHGAIMEALRGAPALAPPADAQALSSFIKALPPITEVPKLDPASDIAAAIAAMDRVGAAGGLFD